MSSHERAAASVPWWLFLVTGVLWLLVSLIVLRFNITSAASAGVLLGVILIMAGANEFVDMGVRGGWKGLHAILGVLFIGGGIWAFVTRSGRSTSWPRSSGSCSC
jgi:uncharacterized membrane protein HdeD (DUF308 family)